MRLLVLFSPRGMDKKGIFTKEKLYPFIGGFRAMKGLLEGSALYFMREALIILYNQTFWTGPEYNIIFIR